MSRRIVPLMTALLSLFVGSGLASEALDSVPMTGTPPNIDGRLDEEVWSHALTFDDFKTFKPDYGKTPSQKTRVFMTYDPENFYFAFRCFDTEPDKIKASVSKRDDIFQDDLVGIVLDTFNDMQGGFGFMINPLGIQGDGKMDVTGDLEGSHDMVWYSKGRIDDQGYTVECRIPLQSIRFPNRKTIPMRVLFFRFLVRQSEQASFPAFDPEGGSLLGQSHPIQVTGLKYKRVVELLPAMTHSNTKEIDSGRLRETDNRTDISLTGKIGLTSDLTLDATYNPDFSQVEADAGQIDINLRYSLFFPEKRPFFLEGDDLWRFGGAWEDAPVSAIVHTRTIVDPVYGFKLTGKVTSRDTLAAIYARDDLPGDAVDAHPEFTILRYKHTLKEDSYLGGFYTARDYGSGFNRAAGADGRIRLNNISWVSFHLLGALTREAGGEDASGDHALSVNYNYETRNWIFQAGYQDISRDFRIDTGFVTRTGVHRMTLFGMRQFYPKSEFFQKIEPFYWSYHLYDEVDDMWESFNIFVLRLSLPRSTQLRLEGILANEVFSGESFNRHGFGVRGESQILKQLYLSLFYRRTGSLFYDPEAPYQGYGNRASAAAVLQPTDKLSFILSLNYVDFYRKSDGEKIYDYTLIRSRNIFQINSYLFLRGILEYNFFRDRLTADLLASFTYIPGTVFYVGYGSAFEKLRWTGQDYTLDDTWLETKRGFFFKVSYLWRF